MLSNRGWAFHFLTLLPSLVTSGAKKSELVNTGINACENLYQQKHSKHKQKKSMSKALNPKPESLNPKPQTPTIFPAFRAFCSPCQQAAGLGPRPT